MGGAMTGRGEVCARVCGGGRTLRRHEAFARAPSALAGNAPHTHTHTQHAPHPGREGVGVRQRSDKHFDADEKVLEAGCHIICVIGAPL
jgi:hypothetical protein